MSKMYTVARATVGGVAMATSAAGFAQAQDVAGLYAGASVGVNSGSYSDRYGDEYTVESHPAAGAFMGYNMVSGNLVYGAEFAWTNQVQDIDQYDLDGISNLFDLRGRVGALFGSTLVYGALGYSFGAAYGYGDIDGSFSGYNIGVGFEMPLGNNGFLGGDLTTRFMDASGTMNGGSDLLSDYVSDLNLTTVSVRLGFRF